MRQTSLQAYKSIKPGLNYRQEMVLDAFERLGALTNLEISCALGLPINQVTPRTNELVKKGLLFETGKRKCSVSGRNAIVWCIIK